MTKSENLEKKQPPKVKSKILFIITVILAVITIICLIYKNNCNQKYDEYMSNHMADDIALKWHSIDQSEYNRIEEKKAELRSASNMADHIFIISTATTVVVFVAGVILKIKEKTQNK